MQYLDWRQKEGWNYCKICGKEIKLKSNREMYCAKCKRIKELEKQTRYNQKR